MTDSDRIDALLAVCVGLEARIAQMEQIHKADRERLNRLEGRESQGQNRRGGPETAPDMAATAAADSGASGALQ